MSRCVFCLYFECLDVPLSSFVYLGPTSAPTTDPTKDPTADPTADPTEDPTADPTVDPTADPTADPTGDPTTDPTKDPTADPSTDPTLMPSQSPTTPSPLHVGEMMCGETQTGDYNDEGLVCHHSVFSHDSTSYFNSLVE